MTEAVTEKMTRFLKKNMTNPYPEFASEEAVIGENVSFYPGVIIEGKCIIESGAIIGPNSHLINTTVKQNARIRQSVAEDAVIGEESEVGPFAYLRPGTVIGKKCRVGNFVEIKNSILGDETKMAHLAYIGDADVGKGVNFACGAITCNYDGNKKHRTVIEDGAFIGSNVNLIAPITIEENAFIAAGSTVSKNVNKNTLAVTRAKLVEKSNYRKNANEKTKSDASKAGTDSK